VGGRGGGGGGPRVPVTPSFSKLFLSKQPTTGGENDMTIWPVPSLWHSVTLLWKILATPLIFGHSSSTWTWLQNLSNDDGDPEDNAKKKKKEVIFYRQISQLSRCAQCVYWSQNLVKLSM